MEDSTRRKLDMLERTLTFMTDNAVDFPLNSPGDKAAKKLREIVEELRALAAQQVSGSTSAAQALGQKEEFLDALYLMIRNINRAANAFEDEVPGIDQKFRIPRNRSQASLLATGRAYHADAFPLREKFEDYLGADFLDELQGLISGVESLSTNADSGGALSAAATGGLLDAARRGMEISRKLNAIVKIKYQNSASKLSAWTVASHLDRAPQSKETPVAPNPTV